MSGGSPGSAVQPTCCSRARGAHAGWGMAEKVGHAQAANLECSRTLVRLRLCLFCLSCPLCRVLLVQGKAGSGRVCTVGE